MFSVTTAGAQKVLHSFGLAGDGAYPEADLMNVDGRLYGITSQGGSGCGGTCGTVYSITTKGSETILHSFQGGSDGAYPQGQAHLLKFGGALYGTTFAGGIDGYGVVFSVTRAGSEKVVYAFTGSDGDYQPLAGLTRKGTTYYGTTEGLPGAVYSITPAGAESVIHRFEGGRDGYAPYAGLTKIRARLFGTTAGGGGRGCGSFGCGTVFTVHP